MKSKMGSDGQNLDSGGVAEVNDSHKRDLSAWHVTLVSL